MANPYQKASSRRKLIYFGIIGGLFAVTIFARGVVAMPFAGSKNSIAKWTIQGQSDRLELNEISQGDVELTGSAVRLLLTGSRGLAICGLWISASEKQKRQEWNELELVVKSITKLQPHFIVPWLFQSWNLAYNVSVEMDRLNDMYFYIGRGINLLAEGESVNRNNPEIRYQIAFYYQNKFGVSDKVTTLRCMMQLSCIPKDERTADSLKTGGQIDLEKVKAFCEKHPQLVRRLRETKINYGRDASGNDLVMYLASRPKDLVDFLKENETLPNRFRDDDPKALEDRLKQFPVLPQPFYRDAVEEINPERPIDDGRANAFRAARVWFRYANEVIPLPEPRPSFTKTNYIDPEGKRRMPTKPMLIIFRQGPPRAQSYIAENIAKEGWFDGDPWIVDSPESSSDRRWFREEVAIKPTTNSQEEWSKAWEMWKDHGKQNGMWLEGNEEKAAAERLAEKYARHRGAPVGSVPPMRPDEANDEEMVKSFVANEELRANRMNLQVTQFENFLFQAEAEGDPETIETRKLLFQAEEAQKNLKNARAIAIYERAFGTQEKLGLWGKVLLKRNRFRTDHIQQETYENQLRYMKLVRDDNEPKLRQAKLLLLDVLRLASPAQGSPAYLATSDFILSQQKDPPAALAGIDPLWPPGPFDGVDPENNPWIPDSVKERVLANTKSMQKSAQQPSSPKGP